MWSMRRIPPGINDTSTPRLQFAISKPAAPPQRREHQALRQELADDARPAAAERGTNGELPSARVHAAEQETGDIRTRNEQHESGGAEQCQQRFLDVAVNLFGQRTEVHAEAVSSGRVLLDGGVHLFLGDPWGDTTLQPGVHADGGGRAPL